MSGFKFYHSGRSVKFVTTNIEFRPSDHPQLRITFNYLHTLQTSYWIKIQNSTTVQLINSVIGPQSLTSRTSIGAVRKSLSYDDVREAVRGAIGDLPEGDDRDLTKPEWEEARRNLPAAGTLLPFSVLDLFFRVVIEDCRECVLPASFRLLEESEVAEKRCCSICLEDLRRCDVGHGSGVLRTPCSHVFHGGCIMEWLTKSPRCPLCRYEMPAT